MEKLQDCALVCCGVWGVMASVTRELRPEADERAAPNDEKLRTTGYSDMLSAETNGFGYTE